VILSSSDIYSLLTRDPIVSAIAAVRIVKDRPALEAGSGVHIYIQEYPNVQEFTATWPMWIVDYDEEPLDVVLSQLKKLVPNFQIIKNGALIHASTTDLKIDKTEVKPIEKQPEISTADIEAKFKDLQQSIEDRMLLVGPGRPGRDGARGIPGKDGRDGVDGKDLQATDVELGDLKDVFVSDAKNRQFLMYDGSSWIPSFVPQIIKAGTGGGNGSNIDADMVRQICGIDQTGEPMGHANKLDSTITFNNITRTFTIAPVASSFDVWVRGIKFTYTQAQSIQIPDVSDLYYIFFDSNGDIGYQTSFFVWDSQAFTSYIYWNASEGVATYFGDERHGIVLDWQTHEYLHRTRGASLASGFGIQNYTVIGDGSLDTHAQIDILNGTFFDEDQQIDITHSETPTPQTWEQHLIGPAKIPASYHTNNGWTVNTANNFPIKTVSGQPVYNLNTSGSWSLVNVDENKYFHVFIVATHNLGNPVISVLGQRQDTNIGNARSYTWSDLDLQDFPSLEFRPLYHLIYQHGVYGNSVNARLREVVDIRYSAIGAFASGLVGEIGATGATGVQGDVGATGPKGDTGDIGATGPQGDAFDLNYQGAWNSATAYVAYQSVSYDNSIWISTRSTTNEQPGTNDAWVTIAAQGAQGATGPQGPIGFDGATGPQGVGEIGATGAVGPVGEQGPQGPAGADGQDGTQGPPGPNITFQGSVANVADLPSGANVSDAYTVINEGYAIFIWNGSAWVDGGPLQGPQGIQGPAGPLGPQGPAGATGATGAAGPQGNVGPAGGSFLSARLSATINSSVTTCTVAATQEWPLIPANVAQYRILIDNEIMNVTATSGTYGSLQLTITRAQLGTTAATHNKNGLVYLRQIIPLPGATGIQGATGVGVTGATGPQGATGAGVTGATGPQGATGVGLSTGLQVLLDDISPGFDSAEVSFPLTYATTAIQPAEVQNLLVVLDGNVLEPIQDYTVSGSTITFAIAPSGTSEAFLIVNSYRPAPVGISDLADVSASGSAIQGQALVWNGFAWAPGSVAGSGQRRILDTLVFPPGGNPNPPFNLMIGGQLYTPVSDLYLDVYKNKVKQIPGIDYTVNSYQIIFTDPISPSEIVIIATEAASGSGLGMDPDKIRRHDYVAPYSYTGTANEGTLESDPDWVLTRIQVLENGDAVNYYAIGSWTNRSSADYTLQPLLAPLPKAARRFSFEGNYSYAGTNNYGSDPTLANWQLTRIETLANGEAVTLTATDSWYNRIAASYS
jgi:hypothetical protein